MYIFFLATEAAGFYTKGIRKPIHVFYCIWHVTQAMWMDMLNLIVAYVVCMLQLMMKSNSAAGFKYADMWLARGI